MSRPTAEGERLNLVPVTFANLKDFAYFCDARTLSATEGANWYCKNPPTEISKLYAGAENGHRRINYTGPTESSCGWIEPARTVYIRADRVADDLIKPTEPPKAYRRPTGSIAGADGTVPQIYRTRAATQTSALLTNLERASQTAASSIALQGSLPIADERQRIGLPEALLTLLEGCGDPEAARLACEAFLERNPRPIDAPHSFFDYHGYGILPVDKFSFIIIDRVTSANLLRSSRHFESFTDAQIAIDVFREVGNDGFEEAFEEATTS